MNSNINGRDLGPVAAGLRKEPQIAVQKPRAEGGGSKPGSMSPTAGPFFTDTPAPLNNVEKGINRRRHCRPYLPIVQPGPLQRRFLVDYCHNYGIM